MRTANVFGYVTGRFGLLEYTSSTSTQISSYNNELYAVIKLNPAKTDYLVYRPNSQSNTFTIFEPNTNYLIFSKQNFSLSLDNDTSGRIDVVGEDSNGVYSLGYYPFNETTPFSAYDDKLVEIKATNFLLLSGTESTMLSGLTAAVDGAVFESYKPDRSLNSATHFTKGQTYIIKAKTGFIVYNPDVDALLHENGSFILLENNNKDRLLLG